MQDKYNKLNNLVGDGEGTSSAKYNWPDQKQTKRKTEYNLKYPDGNAPLVCSWTSSSWGCEDKPGWGWQVVVRIECKVCSFGTCGPTATGWSYGRNRNLPGDGNSWNLLSGGRWECKLHWVSSGRTLPAGIGGVRIIEMIYSFGGFELLCDCFVYYCKVAFGCYLLTNKIKVSKKCDILVLSKN